MTEVIETIITMDEARDTLRVDGDDNDEIINGYLISIPSYIEVATGYKWNKGEQPHELAKTATKFILQLWFDPQTPDSERLKRTIDNLLITLTMKGNDESNG